MPNNRILTTNAIINGKNVPVIGWQCHMSSYGNLCTFEVTTSIQALKDHYPAIFTDQNKMQDFECQIFLSDSATGTSGIVFDGIIDTIDGTWEDDLIEISGRDYSAILRDTTLDLSQYVHATVAQVVQTICQKNNLNAPIIQAPDTLTGIQVNSFQGEDWSFSIDPKPNWTILQELADEVDCVVWMDRLKTLHFVPAGAGGASHTYNWRPTPDPNGDNDDLNPILKLSMMQQSRRCNNFTLFLHGYDRSGKQQIYKSAAVGDGGGRFIHKRRPDVNAQNYQQLWTSIKDEIQRKNTVVKMVVEGNLELNVNDTITVNESEDADLLGLSGRQLFIVSVTHGFSMPDYGADEGDGFLTHLTCNQATNDTSVVGTAGIPIPSDLA